MFTEDPTPHLEQYDSYEQACREFAWRIPERFNIVDAVCRRHKDTVTRLALIEVRPAADNLYTFGAINYLSDKFANALKSSGMGRGDVVAVILSQSAALPVAHLAALKLGGVVLPLDRSMSSEAIEFRLADSGAKFIVVDADALDKIAGRISPVEAVFVVSDGGNVGNGYKDFWREVRAASSYIKAVETDANTPAFIFYVADKHGNPAGVVYNHGFLIGQLPAFEMMNDFKLGPDTVFWMPGDWASIHPLFAVLYPAWHYGRPVAAYNAEKDDGGLSQRCGVTNLLITPERSTSPGITISEGFGLAEGPLIAANCERWFAAKPDSLGRAAPGHVIGIVDGQGNILPHGKTGYIALRSPDPSLSFRLLKGGQPPDVAGEWFITGEKGYKDEDDYLWRA